MQKILIIDNNTTYIDSIVKLISNYSYSIIKWDELNDFNVDGYNLIILTGGHPNTVFRKHNLYKDEVNLIKSSNIPILGICFGFELIAYAFGAKLNELSKKEKKVTEIKVISEDEIFDGIKKLKVFESHRWAVNLMPEELVPLARSKDGIEIFKHKSKKIYGFQFHPEIVVDKKEKEVFRNVIKSCGITI